MASSSAKMDGFFVSCLKHADIDWDAVCKERGLTRNAAKKRWNRWIDKQGVTADNKTPERPSTTKKGAKLANDKEETPSKPIKQTKKLAKKSMKAYVEVDEIAADDGENGEDTEEDEEHV